MQINSEVNVGNNSTTRGTHLPGKVEAIATQPSNTPPPNKYYIITLSVTHYFVVPPLEVVTKCTYVCMYVRMYVPM